MDLPLLQSLVLKRKISPLRKVSQREGTILLFFVVSMEGGWPRGGNSIEIHNKNC